MKKILLFFLIPIDQQLTRIVEKCNNAQIALLTIKKPDEVLKLCAHSYLYKQY